MTTSNAGRRRANPLVVWAVVASAALVLLLVFVGPHGSGPPLPGSEGPGGTLVLHRFLRGSGIEVSNGHFPLGNGQGTFVLFADFRAAEQDSAILDWVRQGGHLVLMDPSSELAARLAALPRGSPGGAGTATLRADCLAPEAVASRTIEVDASDLLLGTSSPESRACFGGSGGSYEVVQALGYGTATVLGGHSPFTNALLDRADNAEFALQVLGSARPVVFGSAEVPGLPAENERPRGLWASLPIAAKAAIFELMAALVAFALVRGRRLGKPVLEDPLSPIPAGELVRATGRLYRRARSTAFAGQMLRAGAAGRLRRRLGVPASASPSDLAAAAAAASGMPGDRIQWALAGPDPVSDDDLIALGRELETIQRAAGGWASARTAIEARDDDHVEASR